MIIKNKLLFEDSPYRGDDWRQEPWRETNNIIKKHLKGEYKILMDNIKDCNKMPSPLKFVAFGWEELKIIVYREPNVSIYEFEDYNKLLSALKINEQKFLSEGMTIHQETEYKRAFLFKDLDKQIIKELKKGDKIIKQGDFLATSWGYDQTNVELFIIKKIIGKNYLIIQEVSQAVENSGSIAYDKVSVANTINKTDIPIKAYVSNEGYLSVCELGYKRSLHLTTMDEQHYKTDSRFGH